MSEEITNFLATWDMAYRDGWDLQDYINELNEVTLRT